MVLPAPHPTPSTTTVPAMLHRITTTTNFEPNTLQVEVANTLQVEAATWPKRGFLLTTVPATLRRITTTTKFEPS